MQEYNFEIINARFTASGVATQAKGPAYRLRPNKGRDAQKSEDYGLGAMPGISAGSGGPGAANEAEEPWAGGRDYWLGRTALTDLAINIPGEGVLYVSDISINVSMQKEIVRTALVGRRGTIKEYVTDGDYQLDMSVGLVAADTDGRIIDQYPERAVAQLRGILERPEALEVSSAFLDLFGITRIVVTGFAARQMTHSNRQEIAVTAVSDTDYVITTTEY